MSGKKRTWPAAAFAGGLAAFVALAGCGKEPSVASRSAAAFREAQKTGETPGGGAHGHGALTPGGEHEMPGSAPESGSAAGHSGMAMEGMDHSKMKGMEHSGMAMESMDTSAEPKAVSASSGQPAMTLRPDALDAPAPTSEADAQRSAEMSEEMKGMGGMGGHGMGTYRQVDAGRGPGAYEGSEKQIPGAEPHHHAPPPPPPSGQAKRRKG